MYKSNTICRGTAHFFLEFNNISYTIVNELPLSSNQLFPFSRSLVKKTRVHLTEEKGEEISINFFLLISVQNHSVNSSQKKLFLRKVTEVHK